MLQFLKTLNPFNAPGSSRGEMERRFRRLPVHVQEGLKNGSLHLADTAIYSIKPMDRTIRMFEEKDDRELGLRNISGGRLEKNQCLLLTGLRIMSHVAPSASKEDIISGWDSAIEVFPPLVLGEFCLKVSQRIVIPETPNIVFRSEGDVTMGASPAYYKLANPVLINEEERIELTIELGSMKAGFPGSLPYVKAALFGTITTP